MMFVHCSKNNSRLNAFTDRLSSGRNLQLLSENKHEYNIKLRNNSNLSEIQPRE